MYRFCDLFSRRAWSPNVPDVNTPSSSSPVWNDTMSRSTVAADHSVEDPTPESPGVCFERAPSGSPKRLRTRAGERVTRRHDRTLLSDRELKFSEGGRQIRNCVCRPIFQTLPPATTTFAPGAGARVHRRSCAAAAASPSATARSRRRDSRAWDLRLSGRLRPCIDLIVPFSNLDQIFSERQDVLRSRSHFTSSAAHEAGERVTWRHDRTLLWDRELRFSKGGRQIRNCVCRLFFNSASGNHDLRS
jgi:hypothetical protein